MIKISKLFGLLFFIWATLDVANGIESEIGEKAGLVNELCL